MNDFWEARFSSVEYAYGTEPNEFFRQQLAGIQNGRILFAAEGEGRNAVYAAGFGFEVHAFDLSLEGRRKALALASNSGVKINYVVNSYENVSYPDGFFDVLVLIFAHMPPQKRREWHRKLAGFLGPGGKVIIEGFSKDQLHYDTGGPSNIEMLFSEEELKDDFNDLRIISLDKRVVFLDEGLYHKGKASVVSGVFQK